MIRVDELTWQDVKQIILTADRVVEGPIKEVRGKYPTEQSYYEAVLAELKR